MSINLQIKYYVFEKKGVFVACPYPYYLTNPNGDDLSIFGYMLQQGFSFYDADFHQYAMPIYAETPDKAIDEAKRDREKEFHKLKIEIARLKADKEFSFKDGDAYKVFGVPEGTSIEEIKKIHTEMIKMFHPDNSKIKSNYLTVIINQAYSAIKKQNK